MGKGSIRQIYPAFGSGNCKALLKCDCTSQKRFHLLELKSSGEYTTSSLSSSPDISPKRWTWSVNLWQHICNQQFTCYPRTLSMPTHCTTIDLPNRVAAKCRPALTAVACPAMAVPCCYRAPTDAAI